MGSSPTVKIHDEYVYLSQVGSFGIKRIPLPSLPPSSAPTLVAVRPLLVSCGGKNLVKAGNASGEGGSHFEEMDATQVVRLGRSATGGAAPVWTDGSLDLGKAPTLATLGLKIRSTKDPSGTPDESNYAARLRLSTDSSSSGSWNNLTPSGFTWATGTTQVRRVRCWVRDGSHDQTGSITPNKTNNIQVRPWDEIAANNTGGNASWYSCSDRWAPCTFIGARSIAQDLALGLRISSHGDGDNTSLDDNYGYVVVGEAYDGNGAIPYPIAPETEGPDEHLSVSDFSLGTNHNWWVKLALMTPMGNWDQWAGRLTTSAPIVSDRRWPLFTLWGDEDNWIEFSADCEGRGFRVRVKRNGGTPTTADFGNQKQVWLPESPLLVAIGFNSTTGYLSVGASLGGGLVSGADEAVLSWDGEALTELRYRGATGEVCEVRIIGGEINPAGTLGTLASAFTDLGFLNVS